MNTDDHTMILHGGKHALVHNYIINHFDYHKCDMYYLSIVGSRQMAEGIAAALLDSGRNNINSVYLAYPPDEDTPIGRTQQIKIATNAIGSMKRKTKFLRDCRQWQVVLYSELLRWDYGYTHIKTQPLSEDEQRNAYQKRQEERARRQFVLTARPDEPEADIAQRFVKFLAARAGEPLLAEWALPLWNYCMDAGKGITPLASPGYQAWFCVPTSEHVREAISELGRSHQILPPKLQEAMNRLHSDMSLAAD